MEYRVDMSRFGEIRKMILVKTVPLMLLAAAAGIAISFFNTKDSTIIIAILPFIIPLFILVVAYGLYRAINKQKQLMGSYVLSVSSNVITRLQDNTPTINICFEEVTQIIRTKPGGMIIKGKNAADTIIVLAQTERIAELATELSSIMSITEYLPRTLIQKSARFAGLLNIVMMLCLFISTNKVMVAISGTIFVAFMLWAFSLVRKNKSIDTQTKRKTWYILLPVFAALVRMVAVLSGKHF